MTSWMETLADPRRSTRAWLDSGQRAVEVGYGGPADGDFARYVDQLLAQAEAQQRSATGKARAPAAAATATAAPGTARARPPATLARAAGSGLKALFWRKLLPMALLLVAGVAVFFWQGTVFVLFGLLILLGMLTRGLRGKKR